MRIDFEKLREDIQKYFPGGGPHRFDHTERVYNVAVQIAKDEGADLEIIKLAALLHDVARKDEFVGLVDCHAEGGAKIARKVLEELNMPEEKIERVVHCIEVHRFKKQLKPQTKEAEILQDADRLDALGTMVIARVFSMGGERGIPIYDPEIKTKEKYDSKSNTAINHFYEKILKIKPESFHTKFAKEKAKKRYEFVENFLERFHREWEGKD